MRDAKAPGSNPFTVVLGIAQDGGYPHAGCERSCCRPAWKASGSRRRVSCLGIVNPVAGRRWLVDATPDLGSQLHELNKISSSSGTGSPLDGILLTHAHIGHYLGLGQLGREVMGARGVPVFAMPRMSRLLRESAPWAQLVTLGNIELREIEDGRPVELSDAVTVTPHLVPHRGEYSETVGYRIEGPCSSVLYVPDIDGWEGWEVPLEDAVAGAGTAYLDGTFYDISELPGAGLKEVPHPTIAGTMRRLAPLSESERRKIRFLHLNHTNDALRAGSAAAAAIERAGFRVAMEGERVHL